MTFRKYVGWAVKNGSHAPMLYGLVMTLLLPYLHIGIVHLKFWVPDKPVVDKEKCTCSCFDTVFKGTYERPGKSGYKHVYFNATLNTFKIWAITVVFLLMLYEGIKHLVTLLQARQLRYGWAILFFTNLYPNYYSWWNFFGYYNDEFYSIFNHQTFFCVTELCVSVLVVRLFDVKAKSESWKLLTILSISSGHILVAGRDQFISNVFRSQGASYQTSRDWGLMIPDLCHVVFASNQYWRFYLSQDSYGGAGRQRLECASFLALTICLTLIPTLL